MKIEAVLLDMGGVLLDFKGTNALPAGRLDYRGRLALADLLAEGGGKVSLEELEETLFAPWRRDYEQRYPRMREAPWAPHLEGLRSHLEARGHRVTRDDLSLLGAWFEPYRETVEPVPGAAGALARLAGQGLSLALISNVPLPGALYRSLLDEHGLAAPFASFHFSSDEGHRKPSPRMLLSALSELGCPPERAVMVGDRPATDIAAGRAAGTRTVWVRPAHAPAAGGPEADSEIASVVELPALLADWAARE